MRKAFFGALLIMFFFGTYDMTKSVAGPLMQSSEHLSYLQLGNLFASNSIGYFAGSFLTGLIIDVLPGKRLLYLGGLLNILPILGITLFHAYPLVLVSFLLVGLGTGILEIVINHIVPVVADGPVDQHKKFNLLHGIYGLGAFVFPTMVVLLARATGRWQSPFWTVALFMVGILLFVTPLQWPHPKTPGHQQEKSVPPSQRYRVFKSPMLYLLFVALTVYTMAESGISGWLPSYLVHGRSTSDQTASLYMTGFYAVFTMGRLFAGRVIVRFGSTAVLLGSSLFATLLLLLGCLSPNLSFCLSLAGLGCAAVFPTIVSVASNQFPKSIGLVQGVLFTGAGCGTMLMNWLIGFIGVRTSLTTAFFLIPVCLIIVLLLLIIIALRIHEPHSRASTDATAL